MCNRDPTAEEKRSSALRIAHDSAVRVSLVRPVGFEPTTYSSGGQRSTFRDVAGDFGQLRDVTPTS